MTTSLKRVMNIIKPDFPPAADGIKCHPNKSIRAATPASTSGMLTYPNEAADNNNCHRSGKGIQRNMQQYHTAHGREDGYTPLHGLVCLVSSSSLAGLA